MSSLNDVKNQLASNPDVSADYIVKILGVTKSYAYVLLSKGRKELGIRKLPNGEWGYKTRLQATPIVNPEIEIEEPKPDNVNHPAHYKVGGIETIDFIEAKGLGYNLGNVVKYVTRADHKGDRRQDLEKARWYLEREIANLK